ncbi:hypothetical protein [Brevundimonas sp.]|jgi:predicted transcriptional regulator|uniref:HVO_A0114 family putative DNA-binding protein n=1 Tax=Brevundimonas sp. TaxID=1871086 RepID=UPI003783BFF6
MTIFRVHVGETLEDLGGRVIDVWNRAEAGERVTPEEHLSFDSFETLARILTPKRLTLLRHLHAHPAASIAALARDLGRDYKRVHEDVEALSAAGLIERDGGLTAPFDEIQTRIAI